MERLKLVCSLIDKCESFADIGCDHGFVAKYVCENSLAESVYATDISEKSLEKARLLLKGYGFAKCLVGDGMTPLKEIGVTPETAVICGMGGELIISILSAAPKCKTLILGAQKNQAQLRSYLVENGYELVFDAKVAERGKFYDIIKAKAGSDSLDEIQLNYGKFYKKANADLKLYLDWLMPRLDSYKQTERNVMLKKQAEEVLKWQL